MSADGKSTADTSNSTSSFISALVMGLLIAGVLITLWFILHTKNKRIFQPRTLLPPVDHRAPDLPNGPLAWLKDVITAPDSLILKVQGPDAYMFIRFIKLSIFIFAPFFLVTWIILMPLSGTGSGGLVGLNKFTFGNIGENQQPRIVAYFLVAILLTLWVLYLVDVEYRHYRIIRQEWLASPKRAGLPQSRTVAILNLPPSLMSKEAIEELAGDHGTVQQVWLSRQVDDMEEIFEARNKEVGILEGNIGSALALAAKNVKKNKLPPAAAVDEDDLLSKYIKTKKRPSHKRGFLGLFGTKVDTLKESPAYIQEKDEELSTARKGVNECKLGDAAFVRFATKEEAHAFAASIGKVSKGAEGEIEVMPEDIFWPNLLKSKNSRLIGSIVSWALTVFLIIIWAIPVALVGFISNINTLTQTVKFLSFLEKLPAVVIGIIQGILPPVLLAVLFMLLPVVLRIFVRMSGRVLKSQIELELFTRFWLFQVIHGFLIVTLASGLISALSHISGEVKELPQLLSKKLPTASTFFLQWLALYAFTSFGLSVSRIIPFIMNKLSGLLSGPTPRKEWKFGNKMLAIAFATTWPPVALLTCVGLVYSLIQPVITVFALFTFCALYVMYKYVLIWVADQPASLETGGEYMRKAFVCIFVSLYLELICLCGLFFLSLDTTGKQSKEGLAGGALMVVLIVFTAVFHWVSTHIRQPARACHFIAGSLRDARQSNESKVAVAEDGQEAAYPPTSKEGGEGDGFGQSGLHEHAFDHPATWKPASVVWIADDTLGLGKIEAAHLNEQKVPASTAFATMDAEGKVHVERGAPDEEWLGGISNI